METKLSLDIVGLLIAVVLLIYYVGRLVQRSNSYAKQIREVVHRIKALEKKLQSHRIRCAGRHSK